LVAEIFPVLFVTVTVPVLAAATKSRSIRGCDVQTAKSNVARIRRSDSTKIDAGSGVACC
jgi:hypothetical protein